MSERAVPAGGAAADPLSGLRILVPRAGGPGDRAAAEIRARGGVPVVLPLIETAPAADPAPLMSAVAVWNDADYDWLVVTSAAGAEAVGLAGARPVSGRGIAAVGPVTAAALAEQGLLATLTPERSFTGAELGAALVAELATGHAAPARILLAVSEIAGADVERELRAAGHEVDRVTAYRTRSAPLDVAATADVRELGVDAVLVTSGSVARELATRIGAEQFPLPARAILIAIGPPTAAALRAAGLSPALVAATHTISGMLDTLTDFQSTRTHPGDLA